MNLTNPDFNKLLDDLAASAKDNDAAIAYNHLFEERVSASRKEEYEAVVGVPATKADWSSLHNKKYLGAHVKIPGDHDVPTTFLAINDAALCRAIEGNQDIIRIENLEYAFRQSSMPASIDALQTFLKERDTGKSDVLDLFVRDWNKARFNWPMFGTFYDIVAAEIRCDVILAGGGFHGEFAEYCSFLPAEVIKHQALGRNFGDITVGDEQLGIRAEAAVAVGVEEFGADDLVFGIIGVLEKHVPDLVFDAECRHDFIGAAPGEVGDAATIWDNFAEVFAVKPGGEHGGSERSLLDGSGEEEETIAGGVDDGVLNEKRFVLEVRILRGERFVYLPE